MSAGRRRGGRGAGIPTWSVTTSWRRGRQRWAARLGDLDSRGVLRLRPRHETAAPRPGGDQNLPALPQHHAAGAGAGVQAVHGVLRPGCAVEASAARGLQHLRYRRRGLTVGVPHARPFSPSHPHPGPLVGTRPSTASPVCPTRRERRSPSRPGRRSPRRPPAVRTETTCRHRDAVVVSQRRSPSALPRACTGRCPGTPSSSQW